MHHDQDTVHTSYDWMQALLIRDRARVSFAEHGARDNPWIESLWGYFKVENGSLPSEAATLKEPPVCDRSAGAVLQHRAQALGAWLPSACDVLERGGDPPKGLSRNRLAKWLRSRGAGPQEHPLAMPTITETEPTQWAATT